MRNVLEVINLCLAFYNVGTIWANDSLTTRPSTRYGAPGSPAWAVWGNLACFALAIALTGTFWAPWQAKLENDNTTGGQSPWLKKILDTHWIRVVLVNASAGFALALVPASSTKR